MKIVTILGTRPQFIKAAPVSRALVSAGVSEVLVHTGQHFDSEMSDIFFSELRITRPAFNLGIHGGGHGSMTGAMLQAIEPLLQNENPDWVIVYGDTNSTLAGALTAAKLQIPVAHVEAGLRSFNSRMPEEQNRIVTDHLSDILFTPTDAATTRLREEGIPSNRVHQVGDVMFDAALQFGHLVDAHRAIFEQHCLRRKGYILATIHRAENTDNLDRLRAIIEGLGIVANKLMPVLLPLHPRTRHALELHGIRCKGIRILDPVGYLDMIALERQAAVIATDSGGVQKEAYFHGVPCVTVRNETEWVELLRLGWNRLVSADAEGIAKAVGDAIGTTGQNGAPYGDGRAAEKIIGVLVK